MKFKINCNYKGQTSGIIEIEEPSAADLDLVKEGWLIQLEEDEVEETPVEPRKPPPGRWSFDPARFEGMSLEQVNIFAKEQEPSLDPFEDLDEAIAFLSQDLAEE